MCNDAIPIYNSQVNRVNLLEKHWMKQTTSDSSNTFKNHIAQLPTWKEIILTNYSEIKIATPLIQYIQLQSKLLIVTDGSKPKTVSSRSWIIATETGIEILSGFNPDFGMIEHIHSHRAELFGVLTVFLLLQEY